MTCLVAVADNGLVWMGGDRAVQLTKDTRVAQSTPKIWKKVTPAGEPLLIGAAGAGRGCDAVEFNLRKLPVHRKCQDTREYLVVSLGNVLRKLMPPDAVNTLLVGYQGRVFEFDNGLCVTEAMGGIMAGGSGWPLAMGSLYSTGKLNVDPRRRLELALEAAATHTMRVAPPFDFLHT